MIRFRRTIRLLPCAATVWKNESRFIEPFSVRKMSQSETSVHPIATSGFSTSQLYDRIRPSYSKEAASFLLEKLGVLPRNSSSDLQPTRILELGAGTGKFTRILQEVLRGSNVEIITSEPLLPMRKEFTKNFPDLEIKDFSAENIDLPDSSVHGVIAAQSFHWFANDKSVSQIQRVLVPGGKLGLIWNTLSHSSPMVEELNEEIILPIYRQNNTPYAVSYEWKKVLDSSEKFGLVEGDESQFKCEQVFTFDELIDRVMSVSVLQVRSDSEKELITEKMKLIWNKYSAEENKMVFPYIVRIYWSERK